MKAQATTIRIVCSSCKASYQTDAKRALKIKVILVTQPDYLKNYKCRKCSSGIAPIIKVSKAKKAISPPAKPAKKKADKIKQAKEDKIMIDNREIVIDDVDIQEYIPTNSERYIPRKIMGVYDHDILMWHLKQTDPLKKNVLFVGDTGTGKSLSTWNFCYTHKLPTYRVVMNAGTTTEDIVGQMVMDETGKFKFEYAVLVKMMQKGGIFVFDEINAGQKEILHILNSVTDFARRIAITQNKGEVVKACDNFLVVACMNPPDEYDLEEMSISLKSRFMPYYFGYDEKVDREVLGKHENKLLEFAKAVRQAKTNSQLKTPLSTRDLLQFVGLRDGLGYDIAKHMIINKFNNGEKQVVTTLIETYMEKSDILAKTEAQTADGNGNPATPPTP